MKYIVVAAILISSFIGKSLAGETPSDSQKLQTSNDKISYSVGYQIGEDFRDQNTDISSER